MIAQLQPSYTCAQLDNLTGKLVPDHLATLKANRLRSLLTMLGIVIGNASVITLVGVGRGAQNLAEGQLSNLGANVLFVVPGNNDTRRQGIDFPRTLVLEDAEALRAKILLMGMSVEIQRAEVNGLQVNRVRVGPFARIDDMNQTRTRLGQEKIPTAVVRQ